MISQLRATIGRVRRWQPNAIYAWTRAALLVAAVAILELGARSHFANPLVWVRPSDVFRALGEDRFQDEFLEHGLLTLSQIGVSLAIAITVGILLGILLAHSGHLFEAVEPYVESYYAIPVFVFYPVTVALFGIGLLSVVLIAVFWAMCPVIVHTAIGIRRTPEALRKYAMSMDLRGTSRLLRVELPYAVPMIAGGVKLALVYSISGVIGSQFILSSAGLGRLISDYYNSFDVVYMYAAILMVILLALLVHLPVRRWEASIMKRRGLSGAS